MKSIKILLKSFFFITIILSSYGYSEIVNKIEIIGNDRISNETIKLFIPIKIKDEINDVKLNQILQELYDTEYFKDVSVKFENKTLLINVIENPIIENISYKGIKSSRILNIIKDETLVKSRSSYNETIIKKEKLKINNILKNLGYYNSNIDVLVENSKNNLINITYDINLGKKSKISKITFIGNKIFKDKKLHRIITSTEYKFWKFISGRKYLNQNTALFDERLLKNFYKNNGYYNVVINSSFAKLIEENTFELIFNIDAGPKFFFGNLSLNLPVDFDKKNFDSLNKLFKKTKGKAYSINTIDKILNEIDLITTLEQYKFIKANVIESINQNSIDLEFIVEEGETFYVDKINIFGNNVTADNVFRNQLLLDEGDPFSEILLNKSVNNIKSLNFFKKVDAKIQVDERNKTKSIDIYIEEKPTGEIFASAGYGTTGGTLGLGIKENNFMGKGISLDSNFLISEKKIL